MEGDGVYPHSVWSNLRGATTNVCGATLSVILTPLATLWERAPA